MDSFASGTGPGVLTDDGCAVAVYARIPVGSEPEIVHDAILSGARVLELGAGTGRITHPLLRLGHPVVAVDSSAAMLAHVHGARTVCDRIEDLDLAETFDAVLLGSHLINVPDARLRAEFLRCCRRHVREGGSVLIERHASAWFDNAAETETTADGIVCRLRNIRRPGPDLLEATMEYEFDGSLWTQSFRVARLDDEHLAAELHANGLRGHDRLDESGTWVRAERAR